MALHLALDALTVALSVAAGLGVWFLLASAFWHLIQVLRGEK
jgi:hypothetical protein